MIDVPDVEKERDGETRPGYYPLDVNARHRLVIEMGSIEQGEVGHILLAKIHGECPTRLQPKSITEASTCREGGRWRDEIQKAEKDKAIMADLEFVWSDGAIHIHCHLLFISFTSPVAFTVLS